MIRYYPDLIQGSDEWLAARCGLLTASEMKLILTPSFKIANNDKTRAHIWELLAQRITGYVEPSYISDDMLRGKEDEIEARILYARHYAPVSDMGFVTNDDLGFTLGYSPDGFVADDGLIECKSRRQRFQIETIVDQGVPEEYQLQLQTGLLVTGRKWIDFVSYSGGLPMMTVRQFPHAEIQATILAAAAAFEARVSELHEQYRQASADWPRLIPTERRVEQEIVL